MREFVSLVVMCSLASPAMAVAQDDAETPAGTELASERPFLDGLYWQLIVSAFYMFNGYRVSGVYNNLVPDQAQRESYPYTNYMGFGLNFASNCADRNRAKNGPFLSKQRDTKLPAVADPKNATDASWLSTKLKLFGVQHLALIQINAVACQVLDVCGKVKDVL